MTVHDYLTRTGGQLAPATGAIPGLPTAVFLGLTVRDFFAAHALTGILANMAADDPLASADLAHCAYRAADALLAERAKLLAD